MFGCLILALFWSVNEVSQCFLVSIRATGRCLRPNNLRGTYIEREHSVMRHMCQSVSNLFMFHV